MSIKEILNKSISKELWGDRKRRITFWGRGKVVLREREKFHAGNDTDLSWRMTIQLGVDEWVGTMFKGKMWIIIEKVDGPVNLMWESAFMGL